MSKHEEYLRHNLIHARGVGINANAEAALERLAKMKCPPKWIKETFEGISERAKHVNPELAIWTNAASDAPECRKP